MSSFSRILLVLAAVLAVAAPAAAATDPYEPVIKRERTYVHCNADKAKVDGRATYGWNTTPSTTSFTANGGCGSLDSDKRDGDGVIYRGTHTGNLDQLTVHAWVIDAGPVRAGVYPEIYADVSVTIDGMPHLAGYEAHLTPIPSSTGLARLLEFSVTKIGLMDEHEAGEHEVEISLESSSYLDGDQVAWVLDASEVLSGVSFSPEQLAGVRIPSGS